MIRILLGVNINHSINNNIIYIDNVYNFSSQSSKPIPPLKNLQFFIYGKFKTPKEDIKKRILKLGGLVVSKLTDTLAAVISTKGELERMNQDGRSKMAEIQEKDIEVRKL